MNLLFFQNIVSPHQMPYIQHLPKMEGVDNVVVIVPEVSLDERRALGWDTKRWLQTEGVKFIVAPTEEEVERLFNDNENSGAVQNAKQTSLRNADATKRCRYENGTAELYKDKNKNKDKNHNQNENENENEDKNENENENKKDETLRYENIACGEEFKGSSSSKGINDNVNVNVNENDNGNVNENDNVNDNVNDNDHTSDIIPQPSDIEPQPSAIRHQPSDIEPQPSAIRHQPSTVNQTWCLFSGINAFPEVAKWFRMSLKYNVKRAIITEPPYIYDHPLWQHAIRFALKDWRYVKYIDKIFVMGDDYLNYYRFWSKHWEVIPFMYCTEGRENGNKDKNKDKNKNENENENQKDETLRYETWHSHYETALGAYENGTAELYKNKNDNENQNGNENENKNKNENQNGNEKNNGNNAFGEGVNSSRSSKGINDNVNVNVNENDNGNVNENDNVNDNVNDNDHTSAIIPQPSDIEPQPSAISHQPSSANDNLKLLYVGALSKRKDVGCLLKAAMLLSKEEQEQMEIGIVGDGDEREALERLADGLVTPVRFYGTQPMGMIPDIMGQYDVLVLPSLHDGWGAVVNEALTLGLYVICSDHCGAKMLVKDNSNGLVFKSNDPKDLAAQLSNCLVKKDSVKRGFQERIEWSREHISGKAVAKYFLKRFQ